MIKTSSKTLIYIHVVFSTKHRSPTIRPEVEGAVYSIIRAQCIERKISLIALGGMPDHVHMLLVLPCHLPLSEVVGRIKGASSKAVNDAGLVPGGFAWQVGYGAFSVSEQGVNAVRRYIENQKEHHSTKGPLSDWELPD
ncbi:MAG TPA: IS200/IS605 family transposase [Flavobacteriales bacterium]|nr:IS200/IS605 family transposase [Flavobacteriales bacterium]HRE75404.1 IS200/IS605 family transposase [Flavobacteriales bacterium]HRE96097.1 IS200/IS605 family transposase [Flavobacteriales bacterium]HRJ35670.1 IS200/IS605 family transposase [Flavobacteriales bacterium]HRJ37435.1 IS200/IS605 family transposase [Flavobacteriales bacterium]